MKDGRDQTKTYAKAVKARSTKNLNLTSSAGNRSRPHQSSMTVKVEANAPDELRHAASYIAPGYFLASKAHQPDSKRNAPSTPEAPLHFYSTRHALGWQHLHASDDIAGPGLQVQQRHAQFASLEPELPEADEY